MSNFRGTARSAAFSNNFSSRGGGDVSDDGAREGGYSSYERRVTNYSNTRGPFRGNASMAHTRGPPDENYSNSSVMQTHRSNANAVDRGNGLGKMFGRSTGNNISRDSDKSQSRFSSYRESSRYSDPNDDDDDDFGIPKSRLSGSGSLQSRQTGGLNSRSSENTNRSRNLAQIESHTDDRNENTPMATKIDSNRNDRNDFNTENRNSGQNMRNSFNDDKNNGGDSGRNFSYSVRGARNDMRADSSGFTREAFSNGGFRPSDDDRRDTENSGSGSGHRAFRGGFSRGNGNLSRNGREFPPINDNKFPPPPRGSFFERTREGDGGNDLFNGNRSLNRNRFGNNKITCDITENTFENFKDTGPGHVPKKRTIEEIFDEDINSADNYTDIRTDDDNIVVTGPITDTVAIVEKWEEADLEESLMKNINRAKYVVPRKIQSYAIPFIMDGFDVKGHAETGSGKTAAFLIPIINKIIKKKAADEYKSRRSHPFALIIEPTRELASQLLDQARKLTDGTDVSVAVAYGKYLRQENLREISRGCDILIGTPGRLRDFIIEEYVLMANLKVLVLDEADRLLEDQFMRDVNKISEAPKFPDKENRQTLMFSATFSPDVQKLAAELLRDHNVMISNQKYASANSKVTQHFIMVMKGDKKEQLLKIFKDEINEKHDNIEDKMENEGKFEEGEITAKSTENKLRRTLVFVQTKRDADVISLFLCQEGIKSLTINGDRPQALREEALEKFRTKQVDVIVSTDVCARGIDIKDLDHVINYDLPKDDYVTYVHRIGRTGRITEGIATSFYDPTTDGNMATALVAGLRNADQTPPQFLVDAAENCLVIQERKENNVWGDGTRSRNGPRVHSTANSVHSSIFENEDW